MPQRLTGKLEEKNQVSLIQYRRNAMICVKEYGKRIFEA